MRYSWMITAFLQGSWRIAQHAHNEPLFHIKDDLITTYADSAILSMKSSWIHANRVHLSNLLIVKKPVDWLNVAKYRNKLFCFNHIRRHGLDVNITIINDTHVRIQTIIPPETNIEFHLERL